MEVSNNMDAHDAERLELIKQRELLRAEMYELLKKLAQNDLQEDLSFRVKVFKE